VSSPCGRQTATGSRLVICWAEQFRYRSPEHWVDVLRPYYGAVLKAFAALDADRQTALEADLIALLRRANRGGAASLVVPGEYLETVITR
jgi:hypothetical protein